MIQNNKKYFTFQNQVIEFSFNSSKIYKDPFNEIDLDVIFIDPNGKKLMVPAFWDGENIWRVRYSSCVIGNHKFLTKCSNNEDEELNNHSGEIKILQYRGNNNLLKHGRLKVSDNFLYLKHVDGTPFLWLGDTWWFAFAKRFEWPEIFKIMTEDRTRKGFNVVQIIAGFYGDSGKEFTENDENEAGSVWDKEFRSINPTYFDVADIKIFWLIHSNIIPCIFGAWGYYLPWLGIEKMKKHWRYIIARWGAYPVVWCVAGEARMPYYYMDYKKEKEMIKEQTKGWAIISAYIREIDPFNNLITIHPSPRDGSYSSRNILEDSSLFDIDMLQTGQYGKDVLEFSLKKVHESLNSKPKKPVINGEVCYEGNMGSFWQETQRFLFWTHMLSGSSGFTYGAEGIWEFRRKDDYLGKSGRWGEAFWDDAINFLGSKQVGGSKKFLEKFEWYRFIPKPEWVSPNYTEGNLYLPYCAGIPKEVRIIYMPGLFFYDSTYTLKNMKIVDIESNIIYKAYYFNPRTGNISKKITVKPNKKREWALSPIEKMEGWRTPNPSMEDWLLILEKE